jgi:hypothetical protein
VLSRLCVFVRGFRVLWAGLHFGYSSDSYDDSDDGEDDGEEEDEDEDEETEWETDDNAEAEAPWSGDGVGEPPRQRQRTW